MALSAPLKQRFGIGVGCLLLLAKGDAAEIFTDFLYWQPYQEGLTYALRFHPEDSLTKVHSKEIEFAYSPGYRVGVATGGAQSVWSGVLAWVRYGNTSSATAHFDPETFLGALWVPPDLGAGALWKAHARWRLQYDVVDAEVERPCLLGRFFRAEPFMGVRGVRISQHVRCQYDDVAFSKKRELFDLVVRGKNGYEAVGLRAGAKGIFSFNAHWDIFAQGSGSLVYGSQKVKWHYVDLLQQNAPNHNAHFRPNVEGALGGGVALCPLDLCP